MADDMIKRGGVPNEAERRFIIQVCDAFDNLSPQQKLDIQREDDPWYHRIEPGAGHPGRGRRRR